MSMLVLVIRCPMTAAVMSGLNATSVVDIAYDTFKSDEAATNVNPSGTCSFECWPTLDTTTCGDMSSWNARKIHCLFMTFSNIIQKIRKCLSIIAFVLPIIG